MDSNKNKISSNKRNREQQKTYRRWNAEENAIYAQYLINEKESFSCEWNRRSKKVFLRLSQLLKNKSVNQCKSHHQKMFKYCGSVDKIIQKFLIPNPQEQKNGVQKQEQQEFVEEQDIEKEPVSSNCQDQSEICEKNWVDKTELSHINIQLDFDRELFNVIDF